MMFSIVLPVYMNEQSIPSLLAECQRVSDIARAQHNEETEFVFVIDGSPDNSYLVLKEALRTAPLRSILVQHARNFGSFSAIRTGLAVANGDIFAFMAADLQDPPDVLLEFLSLLKNDVCDVAVGVRSTRDDPAGSKMASNAFWWLYRKFIIPEIPPGGVDLFGCNKKFRDALLALGESNSSLVAQIFWLGFRRGEVPYSRRVREHGKSAWTLRKKLKYFFDSIFAFSDLPIRLLGLFGLIGILIAVIFALVETILSLGGYIEIRGFTATMIAILFFGGLNTFGLSIVGWYTWRAYENTKQRPLAVIRSVERYDVN